MPDLFYLVSTWWKQMLALVLLSLITVSVILFFKPSEYLAVTTALPASSYAADKGSVFNKNVQLLYPAMGTPDDLDMIIGTAQLDTVYIAVAEQFGLAELYKVKEQGPAAIRKAAYILKGNIRVIKSDFSELKVKVWDGNKTLAPQLANAITDKLQAIHQDLQNNNNIELIKSLQNGKAKLQADIDSISNYLKKALVDGNASESYVARRKVLTDQIQEYDKLIGEYQLIADKKPPVLAIVERARVSDWPDKPKRLPALITTLVLGGLFSLLIALVAEKRKSRSR
ncbi:MAG: hypothetical protein JNK14_21250 [Chitinophagaceae bacterium]|nr:hypothetical protein [Chitinophagaceae bacterium]